MGPLWGELEIVRRCDKALPERGWSSKISSEARRIEKAEAARGGKLSGVSVVDAAALPGYGREPVGRDGRFVRRSFK